MGQPLLAEGSGHVPDVQFSVSPRGPRLPRVCPSHGGARQLGPPAGGHSVLSAPYQRPHPPPATDVGPPDGCGGLGGGVGGAERGT